LKENTLNWKDGKSTEGLRRESINTTGESKEIASWGPEKKARIDWRRGERPERFREAGTEKRLDETQGTRGM